VGAEVHVAAEFGDHDGGVAVVIEDVDEALPLQGADRCGAVPGLGDGLDGDAPPLPVTAR
jgi:hypothetical protein